MAVVEYTKEGTFLSDSENIAKIRLNRPEAMNSFSLELLDEFEAALDKAEADDEIRAVIITGTGKAFSAGADLKTLTDFTAEESLEYTKRGQALFVRIENFPKGVIAALNGYTFGGGLELACACDLRVASEEAKMGFTEALIGLIPAWGGSTRLPYLIGQTRAREMILTGNRYSAAEAYEMGLLNKVVPADELESTTAFLAAKIADNAPLSIKYSKQSLNKSRTLSVEEGNQFEFEAVKILKSSKDLQEGIRAMLAKRKPEFTGE
jgi:enoyl-CoA hydratase